MSITVHRNILCNMVITFQESAINCTGLSNKALSLQTVILKNIILVIKKYDKCRSSKIVTSKQQQRPVRCQNGTEQDLSNVTIL